MGKFAIPEQVTSASIIYEDLITLKDACKLLPGRPHQNTPRRWASSGVGGAVLKSLKVGGRRCTTIHWLNEFLAEINGGKQRNIKHLEAEVKLDAMDII